MSCHILLASHGSIGSIAAEQTAMHLCKPGDKLDHLYVIPSWWGDMTGDDWLNNGVSRNRFRNYLCEQLWRESQEVVQRVRGLCERSKVAYHSLLQIGRSDKNLEETIKLSNYHQIILGSRRPKHSQGLRDTMLTSRIDKLFADRLHIVSYPDG